MTTPSILVDDIILSSFFTGRAPKLVTLLNGNFLVTFATESRASGFFIQGRQFDRNGIQVGTRMSFRFTREIEEAEFDIVVQPNGQVIIVAETEDSGKQFTQPNIEARTFEIDNAGTVTLIKSDKINTNQQDSSTSYNPAIASLNNRNYRVYFNENKFGVDRLLEVAVKGNTIDRGARGGRMNDIFAGRSDADIDADTLKNGNVVMILDRDSDRGLRALIEFRIFDPDGNQIKTAEFGGGKRTFNSTLEALEEGGFVVAWAQLDRLRARKRKRDTDIYCQMFDTDGNSTTGRILVGDTRLNDENVKPSLTALDDGGFMLFYDKNRGNQGTIVQRFDKEGKKVGEHLRVFRGAYIHMNATTLPDDRVAVGAEAPGGNIQVAILDFGSNVISGTIGNDTLNGTNDDDVIRGSVGNDIINGGDGNDWLEGGRGDDRMTGGQGNDLLKGGPGADRLFGSAGDDTLSGGTGNDVISGGDGSDHFIFGNEDGVNVVSDFDAKNADEVINLSAVTQITSFAVLSERHMAQDGADVVIDDLAGTRIILKSVDINDLDASNFRF